VLFLLACKEDCVPIKENTVLFAGYTHVFTGEHLGDPMPEVAIEDLDFSCNTTVSDGEGSWSLEFEKEEYIRFKSHKDGYLDNYVQLDPIVEQYPDFDWPFAVVSQEEYTGFIEEKTGQPPDLEKSLLVLDILDIKGDGLPGGEMAINLPYRAAIEADSEGNWHSSTVSSGISDLVFVDVEPGLLELAGSGPDGSVCRVPPPIDLVPGTIFLSTAYCSNPN
jgi:hypothetical protein